MQQIYYQKLIENLSDWVWAVDANGIYTFCGANVYNFLGYYSYEIVGKSPFDLMEPDEAKRVGAIFQDLLAEQKPIISLENTIIHKNGSKVIVETNGIPIIDGDGIFQGYQGVDKDITKLRKTESELKKKKEFEAFLENSPDGISILKNNKFIYCNNRVIEILKYDSKDTFMNAHPSKFSPEYQPDGRKSFEKAEEMMQLATQNHGHQFEWMHTRLNGDNFWAEITLTPMLLHDEEVIHVIWRDISEKKENERLLNEQSKLVVMGELIGNIAHQWRQPLNVISVVANNILIDIELEKCQQDSVKEDIHEIQRTAQLLSRTIDDFRGIIKGDIKSVYFNLGDEINNFLYLVNPLVKNSNIKVILNCDLTIEMKGYKNGLTQCLMNIFNNANDAFMNKNAEDRFLFIETSMQNESVEIKIKDSAGGIKEEILEKVFEPYFTTKHKSQGAGLGLYTSYKSIVNDMKGSIKVKNSKYTYNSKNHHGAEFTITLPISL